MWFAIRKWAWKNSASYAKLEEANSAAMKLPAWC